MCRRAVVRCKRHAAGLVHIQLTFWADARPSFYSHKAAPGIVMATGNTGDYLDFAADITCTWLSHDGGATWQDVLNFPGIYEFGDHGGIILMAPHQVRANLLAGTLVNSGTVANM